jgi:hypothetical protein
LLLLLRACLFGSQESREKKMTSFLKVFLSCVRRYDDGREKKQAKKKLKIRDLVFIASSNQLGERK